MHYAGWIVVEQDVLPGLGTPAASARRNREFFAGWVCNGVGLLVTSGAV